MLFNIYVSDLPDTTSGKYGYADDLAILLRRPSWKKMEEGLKKDLSILVDYLGNLHIQLSVGRTASTAYHLTIIEAKRELNVFVDSKLMVLRQVPKYLGVRLGRMLNFKKHIEKVAGKITFIVSVIHRFAGTAWGSSAKSTNSTQAMIFSGAELCVPVWSRSPHVKKVYVATNSSLRITSGCIKPTPVFHLPLVEGSTLAVLWRKAATLPLTRKVVKHEWLILHYTANNEIPPCRLKSRQSYNRQARDMLCVIPEDRSEDAWNAAAWKQEWEASGPTRVHRHVSDQGEVAHREDLFRKHWATLNRLRTIINDRSLTIINEDVGTSGQWSMWVWRARIDGW